MVEGDAVLAVVVVLVIGWVLIMVGWIIMFAVRCSGRGQTGASGPTVQHAVPDVRRDLVLIRDPRKAASRHPARVDIRSGDAVFLRSRSLGRYLDVQGEAVRAHWKQRSPLQKLIIESEAGGAISSGDQVYLRALSGMYLEVGEGGIVSATGQGRGDCSVLTVHKKDAIATEAQILFGDLLHFVAHLPQGQKQLGVDHTIHGGVHARWADQRGDEVFVVEAEDMPSLQRPCGVRLVAESTKSEKEWALSCVHLEADVGVLVPGERLQDGGPCLLVQSGPPVDEAPRVFCPAKRWQESSPSRGRHAVSATGGVFHLGVACQTPLPVHTVRFVQADEEHAAETVLLQEQVAGRAWRTVCRHRAQPAGVVDKLLEPVGVVGFEGSTALDALFGAGFLGSGYDLTDIGDEIEVAIPADLGPPLSFRNATAALAAMKFWEQREDFTKLDCEEADVLSRHLGSAEQHYDDIERSTFGGIFASDWTAMMGVQRAKFRKGSILASALVQTGDTFLIAHSSAATGGDSFWSDSGNGEGKNMLGMQLMLLRDELAVPPRGGPGSWTEFISELYDVNTGMALAQDARDEMWQNFVRDAQDALVAQAFPERKQPRRNLQANDDGQPTFLQTLALFDAAAPDKYSKSNKMSLAYKGNGYTEKV